MKVIKIHTPAKLNLGLRVLGRRPDDYHEILSLMLKVSLFDRITVDIGGKGLMVVCSDPGVPVGEDNLVYKAVRVFSREVKEVDGMEIEIEKRIPVAAGLGGGSSDAASILKVLKALFAPRLPEHKLREIAAQVGADVPFFLSPGAAWASGIGDELIPCRSRLPGSFVLVSPGVEISSAWAYSEWDRAGEKPPGSELTGDYPDNMITGIENEDWPEVLRNDLEPAAAGKYPVIREAKAMLSEAGARGVGMSGSGPVVFGVFSNPGQAEKAGKKLEGIRDSQVFIVKTVD